MEEGGKGGAGESGAQTQNVVDTRSAVMPTDFKKGPFVKISFVFSDEGVSSSSSVPSDWQTAARIAGGRRNPPPSPFLSAV